MLTQERLKELLHYDPETGVFTWRANIGRGRAGGIAGAIISIGYRAIQLDNQSHYCHRLAFLYMTGKWPADKVDHKNGECADNRWANLREATHSQNLHNRERSKNNTSGFKGVRWNERRQKWTAEIMVRRERHFLGCFDDALGAHRAYESAAKSLVGEFARSA